jgi:phosphatidate cytidylyltransferase
MLTFNFIQFRELVRVRYSAYFNTIQDTIPLFRTTQWLWFAVSIFYTYGDFFREIIIQGNPDFHSFLQYAHYLPSLSFLLYSGTFVITIATMQVGHIKFQLNQICWTIVVLCLTVGQLKYIMHNIFNGLFWFALPILLVVTNDIMAYISGMTCGRKFIQRKFISFSPNKTWEGFIGGWLCTMFLSWYISKLLAQFPWMHCPTNKFEVFPQPLHCVPDPIFVPSTMRFPSQLFDLLPRYLSKLIPNVVEMCSVGEGSLPPTKGLVVDGLNLDSPFLTPCVSGNKSHTHHHFELFVTVYPVQMHALVLALFASLVAPFGGFLASAIKRAYHLKDFDSIIPGHGGVMDRMDCQFLMALCTWVHYNTFVKIATISVPKLTYMYNSLTEDEKREFLESVTLVATKGKRHLRLDESFL